MSALVPSHFWFRTISWSQYLLRARGRHSLHSPFAFALYEFLRENTRHEPQLTGLYRKNLMACRETVKLEEQGAGSALGHHPAKTVRQLARHTAINKRYGRLLHALVQHLKPRHILELGTGTGMSACYLATGHTGAKCTTMEGNSQLTTIARHQLEKLGLHHIQYVNGPFDEVLPAYLATCPPLDFVFMDGNHRLEPTLRYFNLLKSKLTPGSCIVVDDIRWSPDMWQAWKSLNTDTDITLSIDFYRLGLLFMQPGTAPQQHTLRLP